MANSFFLCRSGLGPERSSGAVHEDPQQWLPHHVPECPGHWAGHHHQRLPPVRQAGHQSGFIKINVVDPDQSATLWIRIRTYSEYGFKSTQVKMGEFKWQKV